MTDRRDDTYDGPPLAGEEALEGNVGDQVWIDQMRQQFPDHELDWTDLQGLIGDREALVERLAAATGLDHEEVMRRIDVAGDFSQR
jgi:hypothetical protein